MKVKYKKIYKPKPLKQKAKKTFKIDDTEWNKELAKKMINPYYFTEIALQVGSIITLESHHINHTNSKLNIKPN